ncbi:Nucleic-acid-binding protein from transposon X-element, partial [Araneus ventricosus]
MSEEENLVKKSWASSFQNCLGTGTSQEGEFQPISTQPFLPTDVASSLAPNPPMDTTSISEEVKTSELNLQQNIRPKSPVLLIITDEYLAEHSVLITQAITERNSLADWSGAIRFYEPGSKDLIAAQTAMEAVSMSLVSTLKKVNIPLFRLPPSVEALQSCAKVKQRAIAQRESETMNVNSNGVNIITDKIPTNKIPTEKIPTDFNVNLLKSVQKPKTNAASSKAPPTSGKKSNLNAASKSNSKFKPPKMAKKRVIDDEGFELPPKHLISKPKSKKTANQSVSEQIEVTPPTPGMEEVELNDSSETAAEDTLAPPTQKKKRVPPFLITPRADFPVTLNILRLTAPSLHSQMSNKFLKLTVETEDEHRALSRLVAAQGAEFKTFNLKQDRPRKIVLRGLPVCTPLEDVKNEIIKASFDVVSISRHTKFQNKSPMPLVYVQIGNSKGAESIYSYTEILGTKISVESYRGRKGPSQCWRCQGFFHSSAGCCLPQKCVKCAGPHTAKECPFAFDDKLTCSNCAGDHAANWRQCPKFPKQGGKKSATPKLKITPHTNRQNTEPSRTQQPQGIQKSRQYASYAHTLVADETESLSDNTPMENPKIKPSIPKQSVPAVASNTSKIFTDIFTCVNTLLDEDWCNAPLLLKAFKNDLPALRDATHGVDMAYILFEHFAEVRDFVSEQNFDVFLVQETFLPPGFTPLIANYQVYRNDRINNNNHTHIFGGTCIYIKSTIEHHCVPTPELVAMDATIVEIKIGSHPPIKIISAYARGGMTGWFPLADLQKLLNSGPNVIIAGNLNAAHIAWNSPRTSFYGRKLFNYLQGINGIKVLAPNFPTHINLNTWDTVIDLAILKRILFHSQIRVKNYLNSDHLPVILTLDTGIFPIYSPEQFSTNWENFRHILSFKPLPPCKITCDDDADNAVGCLSKILKEALAEASTQKFKDPPEKLPLDIRDKIHLRNYLRRQWQRTRDNEFRREFYRIKDEIVAETKQHLLQKRAEHITSLSPESRTLWRRSKLLRKHF